MESTNNPAASRLSKMCTGMTSQLPKLIEGNKKTIQIIEPTETALYLIYLWQLHTDVIRFHVDNSKDQIVVPFYLHKNWYKFHVMIVPSSILIKTELE